MKEIQYCAAKNKHIKKLLIELAREAGLKEDNKACSEERINSTDNFSSYFFINDQYNKGFGIGGDMNNEYGYKFITLDEMIELITKPQYIDFIFNNQVMKYHVKSKQFYLGGYSLPIDRLKEILKEVEKDNLP